MSLTVKFPNYGMIDAAAVGAQRYGLEWEKAGAFNRAAEAYKAAAYLFAAMGQHIRSRELVRLAQMAEDAAPPGSSA